VFTDLDFIDPVSKVAYFDDTQEYDPRFWATASVNVTGSMDTREIDAYRQGVELTCPRHYCAGTIKIFSGDPNHQPKRIVAYGTNVSRRITSERETFFNEYKTDNVDTIDVIGLIQPSMIGTFNQPEQYSLDGVLQPLGVIPFCAYPTNVQYDPHACRGGFMAGNEDNWRASEQLLTVSEFNDEKTFNISFNDEIEYFGVGSFKLQTAHSLLGPASLLLPFYDVDRYGGERLHNEFMSGSALASNEHAIDRALIAMTGSSSENYVSPTKVSACSGFVYDCVAGTDSIAFGGLEH
jgi:hypothetical protein